MLYSDSLQVMYFSSVFPYVVLICFLVRALLLKGSVDGIAYMFTPKVRNRDPLLVVYVYIWMQTIRKSYAESLSHGPWLSTINLPSESSNANTSPITDKLFIINSFMCSFAWPNRMARKQ